MNILLVDDHALVREGMKCLLQGLGGEVTSIEARNAEEAFDAWEKNVMLDLVLLDLHLPGTDGISTMEGLHRRDAALPVIIMSASEDHITIGRALKAGAAGFIPKSLSRDRLLQAVRLVLQGDVYIPPSVREAPEPGEATGTTCSASHGLSRRQKSVLDLLACGKPNKLIAKELNIAESTVKAHVTEILRLLEVTNRSQALIAAHRIGMP
jgi:two-component system, NarL family, nitrate/nitrite response regulator NarL